jgi:hypothetical protein
VLIFAADESRYPQKASWFVDYSKGAV